MTSDFLNRLLCALIWIPEGYWMYMLMKLMLPPNPDTSVRRRWNCIWLATHGILPFVHYFAREPAVTIVQNGISVLIFCLFALRAFSGRRFTRIFAMMLLSTVPILADILTSTVYYWMTGLTLNVDLYQEMRLDFVWVSGATLIMGCALQGLTCMIWCRALKKRRIARDSGYLLLFLLLGVFILAAGILGENAEAASLGGAFPYIYMSALLAVCGGMFVFLNQVEKSSLETELAEVRRLSDLEHIHYTAVEARREEMAKIRHDYNNILTSVSYLIRDGASGEAAQMLSELLTRLSVTQEQTFCRIPVVDAVVTEKQQQCQKLGISLTVSLNLPEELPISKIDLCSVFSNLVDLAVEIGCRAAASEIALSSQTKQGYLVVQCTIPGGTVPKEQAPDKEKLVLQGIADKYQGAFRWDCSGREQMIQVILRT